MGDENRKLYAELGELTRYIETTMRQLRRIEAPVTATTSQLPQACEHLSSLSKLTEEGTHRVMELAEAVEDNRQRLSRSLGDLADLLAGGGSVAEAVARIATIDHMLGADEKRLLDIMTALSFQDLVGQRIKKILTILEDVEHKLLEMVVVFGLKQDGAPAQVNGRADLMLKELEVSRSTALKQDLVDEILGEFGFN